MSDVLNHFQGNPVFDGTKWNDETKALFARLANAIHEKGLDWWFTLATNSQFRFGRKVSAEKKGKPIGWLYLRRDNILISWEGFAGLPDLKRCELTHELVQQIEDADENSWPPKLGKAPNRKGFWPNDYGNQAEGDDGLGIEVSNNIISAKNVIYFGPPGTGKTHTLQQHIQNEYGVRCAFVTFHQSYGYEDFVEGLRPVVNSENVPNEDSENASSTRGEIQYEIKSGVFVRLCEKARSNPLQRFAIVIDEINRGNISKIFGELITLLEQDKRAGMQFAASVTLPYSGQSFSVPVNVDVIGSMNTADRSLALMDTALRRRFDFIEYLPDPTKLNGIFVEFGAQKINIELLLTTLNQRIEALYDRDHTLGHAYFMQLKNLKENQFEALQNIFKNKIIPLLQEYFFDDWQKIRLVLADNQKNNPKHEFVHEIKLQKELVKLFGNKHNLEQYEGRSRYALNPDALLEPAAYIGIYDPKSN